MIPVYSISKPFLAQAILELGLDLTQPISNYLPGLAEVYGIRKVGALLNHTSGLRDYGPAPKYQQAVAAGEPAWSQAELLLLGENFAHRTTDLHEFEYSNIGYLLLKQALEHTTGLSYFSALNKLVLEPLAITGFVEWAEPHPSIPNYDPSWVYSGTFLGQQDLIAGNLAKLAQHRAETLGLAAGLSSVPYVNTGFENPGYNFGFMVNGNPPRAVGHGGGGPGFEMMALVSTDDWRSALEVSTEGGFNQTEAIGRLRAQLGF
jgi:CubicO group peptidase (beta-lactamase class C family)